MANVAEILMSAEEFFAWQLEQEDRYELVDGVPVAMYPDETMSGASELHDLIVTNVIVLFKVQLRASDCRPVTADVAIRTRIRSLRRADVMVTCGPPKRDVYEALKPRMVVEVLSPSNAGVKCDRKLNEYRRHDALDYILLIDSALVGATLYSRLTDGWDTVEVDTLEEVIVLEKLGCRMTLAEIYEGTGLTK